MKLRTIGLLLLASLLAQTPAHGEGAKPPKLFFYSPEYHYRDGHALNSPSVVTVEQITTDFPVIPQMSGVVLIVYWSTLCPDQQGCDFSIIDKVLEFWRDKGKKVVLDIATIGYPYLAIPDGDKVVDATPKWVMQQIKTYDVKNTLILGKLPYGSKANATFPDFRDPRFLALEAELVAELAKRYDGDPTISQVRIATGLMGEENPMVGSLANPTMPNYHESQWLDYCNRIVELYKRNFKKSELEFDIGRFPVIRARGASAEQAEVETFIQALLRDHIFLAFDGWESADAELMKVNGVSRNGLVYAIRYIQAHKNNGGRIGIEAYGHLINERMGGRDLEHIKQLADFARFVEPDRIVLFGDVAKSVAEAQSRPATDIHARELLGLLGYGLPER